MPCLSNFHRPKPPSLDSEFSGKQSSLVRSAIYLTGTNKALAACVSVQEKENREAHVPSLLLRNIAYMKGELQKLPITQKTAGT